MGLTNLIGFSFFFLTTLVVGFGFSVGKCRGKGGKYFLARGEEVTSGLAEGLFSYVLFWTRMSLALFSLSSLCEKVTDGSVSSVTVFYSLVYIYD